MKKEKTTQGIAFIATAIGGCMSLYYVLLIIQREVTPVPTSWILFATATSLSFWTYRSTENPSFLGNIGNSIDMFSVWVILGAIFISQGGIYLVFNKLEISCVLASVGILVFWKLSDAHIFSNVLLQIVMTIAYIPTINRLWETTKSTESLLVWSIWFIGVIASLTVSILKKDRLGILYSGRGTLLTTIVIILILRLKTI